MSSQPLISICTPTWMRHDLLLSRCMQSVQAQDYGNVEHVIVSDGPDPELRELISGWNPSMHPVRYSELPEHRPEPHWGHYARLRAVELATGDYIGYNDDDDRLRPYHCRMMAAALDANPEAGFAVSRMMSHYHDDSLLVIGWGKLACGNVGTPMIVHRRELLETATWGPSSQLEDWELVQRWLDAEVPYVNVNAETADVYPSIFR